TVGDGAAEPTDSGPIVLGLIFDLGRPPQPGDEVGLLLARRDAVDQLAAPVARRIGQFLRLVFLRRRRDGHADEAKEQQRAQHRTSPRAMPSRYHLPVSESPSAGGPASAGKKSRVRPPTLHDRSADKHSQHMAGQSAIVNIVIVLALGKKRARYHL